MSQSPIIRRAAEELRARHGRLDILINNAGVHGTGDGPPRTVDSDAVRQALEVNFFGVLAVTQAMLPLVRESPSGRIVMVSSGLGSLTLNGDPGWQFAGVKRLGYNGSKAILNMMTLQLAWELRNSSIKVNAGNPGFTATDLNGHRGTQTVAEEATKTVHQALILETGGVVPW